MAVTENLYTGDGLTDTFAFSFPYLEEDEVKVTLDEVATTAWSFLTASSIQFTVAPANGVDIRIYRDTDVSSKKATFAPGTSIRAVDLNENFDQTLYYSQETRSLVVNAALGDIPDGSLGTTKIADSAVTTAKIADDAVTAAKIADSAVVTAGIQDTAVTAAKLATNAVTTAKIAGDAVTNAKIADTAVNTAQMADSAVSTAKIADDAVTTAKLDSTGIAPTVTAINGGPLAGFRNAIINGNFDFWARGTNQTTSGYGSADRWSTNFSGSSCVVSRQPFVLGQTVVPGEPQFHYKAEVTSVTGVNNYALLSQRIEGVRTFAGQEVTVSFWAKADSNRNISVDLSQLFGTGGSPSPDVQGIGASKYAITPTWTKITLTTTMPSISGMSLGTNDDDVVRLRIWFDAGSNYDSHTDTLGQQSGNFFISRVQLEPGPVDTPFEQRPIGIEQQLCLRYYNKLTSSNADVCAGSAGFRYSPGASAGATGGYYSFPTPMRVSPTVDLGSITYSNSSGAAAQVSNRALRVTCAVGAAGNYFLTFSNNIQLDAEL